MWTDFILPAWQSYRSCYYLCFEVRELKTETQRARVTCSRSQQERGVHIKIKDIKKRKEVVCHYLKFIGSEFVCELLWEQTLQGQACVVCGWWATCFSRPWAEMSLFVVHSSFLGLISSGVSGLFHSFSVPFSSEHLECSSGFIWWWRYRCDMQIQSRGGGCRERGLKRPPVLQPPLHSLGSFSSGSQVGWCGL